jgi:hypothetical protein
MQRIAGENMGGDEVPEWLANAIFYEVYPQSFLNRGASKSNFLPVPSLGKKRTGNFQPLEINGGIK